MMTMTIALQASTHLSGPTPGDILARDTALLRQDRTMFLPDIDGTAVGSNLYARASDRVLGAFRAGDHAIMHDVPRVLRVFAEEARAIDHLNHYLWIMDSATPAESAVFTLHARASYVHFVAQSVGSMIDQLRDLAQADVDRWRDAEPTFADAEANIRAIIVAALFDDVTADPFSLRALRSKGRALLYRLMIAAGVAEWVERPA